MIIEFFRQVRPNTRYTVIDDAAYINPDIINWCDSTNVGFVLDLIGYSTLQSMIWLQAAAIEKLATANQSSQRQYVELTYQTRNRIWQCSYRIIAKVEYLVNKHGSQRILRFIITNLNRNYGNAKYMYEEAYYRRQDSENWIREHQAVLFRRHISNHEFTSNQQRMNIAILANNLVKVHGSVLKVCDLP